MTFTRITIDPEILHGGIAEVTLPPPRPGQTWRVEWRVIGTLHWHIAASGLDGGPQVVPDTTTPEPKHRIEWQAALEAGEPVPRDPSGV